VAVGVELETVSSDESTVAASVVTVEAPRADGTAGPGAAVDHPPLDHATIRAHWSELQARIAQERLDRAWFYRCDLHDVEHDTIVLRVATGLRALLTDRKRRMPIEQELGAALGRPVRVRTVDEAAAAATDGEPTSDPSERLPADDPVIQTGLKLFGGPLERVEDATA
jgi:hypothetical protein